VRATQLCFEQPEGHGAGLVVDEAGVEQCRYPGRAFKETTPTLPLFPTLSQVLERWQLSGINRKAQFKPSEWRATTTTDDEDEPDSSDSQGSDSGADCEDPDVPSMDAPGSNGDATSSYHRRRRHRRHRSRSGGAFASGESRSGWRRIDPNRRVKKLTLILKWGGDLTAVGQKQAEALGASFRRMHYPSSKEGDGGLLRLHSTFRHDLKIYTSDEGRVQVSVAHSLLVLYVAHSHG
jgi:hypothetical protein